MRKETLYLGHAWMSSGWCEKPRATTPGTGETARNKKRHKVNGDGNENEDEDGNNMWDLGGDYGEGLLQVGSMSDDIQAQEGGGRRSGNT